MPLKEKTQKCLNCGMTLAEIKDGEYKCAYCGHEFEQEHIEEQIEAIKATLGDAISDALSIQRESDIAKARFNLYEATHEKYIDSGRIAQCAHEVKKYLPKDVQAEFYETAVGCNGKLINRVLDDIDTDKYGYLSEDIAEFMIRTMERKNVLSVKSFIERAFGNDKDKRLKYITALEEEAEKIDRGIYEVNLPRDAFIAYSSKDDIRVNEITEYLESNKITCFVASRNLRHGKGAVESYEEKLKTAMHNCKCVVFMSSVNSRDLDCDALKMELPYIKDNEKSLGRIEFILDEYGSETKTGAKLLLKAFFDGLEYCRDRDDLIGRILPYITGQNKEKNTTKYCASCGTQTPKINKFCGECGGKEFFDSYDLYVQASAQKKLDEEKARLEREKQESEERLKREYENKIAQMQSELERNRHEQTADVQPQPIGIKSAFGKFASSIKGQIVSAAKEQASTVADALKTAANNVNNAISKATGISADRFSSDSERATLSDYDRSEFKIVNTVLTAYQGKGGDVKIPYGVSRIANNAFRHCLIVKSIDIPDGVTVIDGYAFWGSGIESIKIPVSVISIGERAFFGCDRLKKIEYGGTNAQWQNGIIKYKQWDDGLNYTIDFVGDGTSLSISSETLTQTPPQSDTVFQELQPINTVSNGSVRGDRDIIEYDKSLFEIDGTVLTKYKGGYSTHITIPQGVTAIDWGIFGGYRELESITIPDSVTKIGYLTFDDTGLKSIDLPKGMTVIENHLFSDCKHLRKIEIPARVTSIHTGAFSGCESLSSISIPKSVVSIGDNAFKGCRSLITVNFGGTKKEWKKIKKGEYWKSGTGKFVVYCTDGKTK